MTAKLTMFSYCDLQKFNIWHSYNKSTTKALTRWLACNSETWDGDQSVKKANHLTWMHRTLDSFIKYARIGFLIASATARIFACGRKFRRSIREEFACSCFKPIFRQKPMYQFQIKCDANSFHNWIPRSLFTLLTLSAGKACENNKKEKNGERN